ncbi:hypothetical protein [Streptomyces sp. AK02-01A]|uniref:hypothetical protein n=1 Tax=Streptomyces sp. AK02-01A TaxID=3028648 RepID=UPI0029BCCF43|nr:hypothetical protein [Streptomyces sp. AK02-01A]MDX3854227.1 hypothetical protein [Streptomyces sp. AK02-01A]
MTTAIEVLPDDASLFHASATALRWPRTPGHGVTVAGTLGWDLNLLGPVPEPAADLLRIAAAAYLADRHVRRPGTFSRTIDLTVHVVDPAMWNARQGEQVAQLLSWLTGDRWNLQAVPAARAVGQRHTLAPADDVMLLSGGLDSLCGAADHLGDDAERIYVSHYDGSTAIRRAQRTAGAWLQSRVEPPIRQYRLGFHQTGPAQESSSRSRSLLFAALATAVAATVSSPQVTVPENGFTSINPPLTPARGGALSTRSTHPGTFARINCILAATEIPVTISNPYAFLTKGELLDRAHARAGASLLAIAAETLSCSKLDGGYYIGGNANYNCGLCVACLVRRASFTTGRHPDTTPYLVHHLTGASRERLLHQRRRDIHDVQEAILNGIDDIDVLAVGELPVDVDVDAIVDLCQRGFEELSRVPLP